MPRCSPHAPVGIYVSLTKIRFHLVCGKGKNNYGVVETLQNARYSSIVVSTIVPIMKLSDAKRPFYRSSIPFRKLAIARIVECLEKMK